MNSKKIFVTTATSNALGSIPLAMTGQSATSAIVAQNYGIGTYQWVDDKVQWIKLTWDEPTRAWKAETPPAPAPAEPTENEWGEVTP